MMLFIENSINNNMTDGFTLAETLVSIALMLIVTSAFSTATTSVMKNNDAAFSALNESYLILYADQKLRKKIEPVIFPYWENSMQAAKILRRHIIDNTDIAGIMINDAEIIVKNGAAHGLDISYSIRNMPKTYKSSILFSSQGDAIKR